jgi:predicted transcriptional regulator
MNTRYSELTTLIHLNPGIRFREIMRETGWKNGVLTHYINKLERDGVIKVKRGQRQTRYSSHQITDEELKIIKVLRRKTPRDIVIALLPEDGLKFSQLQKEIRKAPSTISLYLSEMIKEKLIEVKFIERKKNYFLLQKPYFDKFLEVHTPSTIEKSTSEFEDIINSL